MSESQPPIAATALMSWRDAMRAVAAMPVVAVIATACITAVTLADRLAVRGVLATGASPHVADAALGTKAQLLSVLVGSIGSCLMAPLAIAVHRYVLLGELTRGYRISLSDRRYLRFTGFALLFNLLWVAPGLANAAIRLFMPVTLTPSLLLLFIQIVLYLVIMAVAVRAAVLFPAIAIDAPGAGWQHARRVTGGHFWRILLTLVCVALPVVALVLAGYSLIVGLQTAGGIAGLMFLLLSGVVQLLLLCAFAAAASHLYRGLNPAPDARSE